MAGTSPLPVMSAIDEAAASLFDSMVPRLEAVLECTRVAAEQSRLRTLLLEQREMVSNRDSGGLAVGKPVYEGAGGVCALAPVTCSVAKAGGGRLAATRSASVSFSVLGLKGGAGMWSRERGLNASGLLPGSAKKLFRDLVHPDGGPHAPVVTPTEFCRLCAWPLSEEGSWAPVLEARLDFGFCDYASPDVLTFEFRLTRVGETVAGPRGLWWDELLRLFVERLEFETEPGAIHRPELTMKLDAISAATLWGSSIEA